MSYEPELVLRFFTIIPTQAIKRILKVSVPSKKTLNVCQTNVNIHQKKKKERELGVWLRGRASA